MVQLESVTDSHVDYNDPWQQSALPAEFCDWRIADGPVLATAVHAGHQIRRELLPLLAADEDKRRRDEDPLTDLLAAVAESCVLVRQSRFEVDLNRPRARALTLDPEETWGIRFWQERPPTAVLERSLALHDAFYARMAAVLNQLLASNDCVLVLDVHSYNHRRGGPDSEPAAAAENPTIDLGITEINLQRWRPLVQQFAAALRQQPLGSARTDVRFNVRYPDGGYFPKWINAHYEDRLCVLTLEYKKMFMDEWSGIVDLHLLEQLRVGLSRAVNVVRPLLLKGQCHG